MNSEYEDLAFRTDRRNVLQHYTHIWEDYKQKYESFPLAQTFLQKQKEVEDSSARLEEVSRKIDELKIAIAELKGMLLPESSF